MNGEVNENGYARGRERKGAERTSGAGREGGRRREARERKPSERNYRRWSLKSSSAAEWRHCRSRFRRLNLRVTDSRRSIDIRERRRQAGRGERSDRITPRWEKIAEAFCSFLFSFFYLTRNQSPI